MTAPAPITTLRQLSPADLDDRLVRGLRLHVGPFVVAIKGPDRQLSELLSAHYPDYPLAQDGDFADACLKVQKHSRWAQWRGLPRLICLEDGTPFARFPPDQLLAQLEWGMNWCIAMRGNEYLMLHGGVVAQGRMAMLLPGVPGAGKSTLTAYLIHRGWRLLSDEFVLVEENSLEVQPFPRLIPLKNESIDVLARAVPEASFGPRIPNTRKGLVAHMMPPAPHIRGMHERALPKLIVFPRFVAGSRTELTGMPTAEAFAELTNNAFNYTLLGAQGFDMMIRLTESATCCRLRYSDLADANERLTELIQSVEV